MKYIEYNHINYYLQEEFSDLNNSFDNKIETPKKEKTKENIFNNKNKVIPACHILTENHAYGVKEIKNDLTMNIDNLKNEIDFHEEGKNVLEELENEQVINNDLLMTPEWGGKIRRDEFNPLIKNQTHQEPNAAEKKIKILIITRRSQRIIKFLIFRMIPKHLIKLKNMN